MIRVGTDIVSIERIKEAVTRTPHLAERVFSPEELAFCRSRANPYPGLAARFAAREALRKLHPVFIKAEFHEIAVINDAAGRPYYRFSPELQVRAASKGLISVDLSLSHDDNQAIAVAVAEWKEDEANK